MDQEWSQKASSGLLKDALTRLALEVQPSITESPLRQRALFQRLKKRSYTRGEILYAVDRLADDPDLDEKLRYGGDLSAADFRRIIQPIRKTRSRLKSGKILTKSEVWRALQTVPELSEGDFRVCKSEDIERRWTLVNQARERIQPDA